MAGIQCFDEAGNLNFTNGDGLARIVKIEMTNGAVAGGMYVPQWEPGQNNRPWFTTLIGSFAFQAPTPFFYIEQPFLRWNTPYGQWGSMNVQMIAGIW
jgi:hypothetical protein